MGMLCCCGLSRHIFHCLILTCAVLAIFQTEKPHCKLCFCKLDILFVQFFSFTHANHSHCFMHTRSALERILVQVLSLVMCCFPFSHIFAQIQNTDSSKNQQTLHVPGLQTRNKSLKITHRQCLTTNFAPLNGLHKTNYKLMHDQHSKLHPKCFVCIFAESPAADKQSQVLHSTAFKIPTKDSTTTTNNPAEIRIPLSNIKFEPILRGHGSNGLLISPSLIMQIENLKEPQTLLKTIASSSSSTSKYPVISHFTSLKQLRQMNDVSDDDCDAADREVCSLMSPDEPPMPPPRRLTSNASTSPSIVSGSWSKMRVVRLNQKFHKFQGTKEQDTSIATTETVPPRRNYVARVRGAINLDALNEPRSFDSGGIFTMKGFACNLKKNSFPMNSEKLHCPALFYIINSNIFFHEVHNTNYKLTITKSMIWHH